MKAAIYTRKSTDDDRTEENKSVARQVERSKAYAKAKGWTVAPEHIFEDDGISGGEFVNRPGFTRLMDAARRREFGALVMSEPSRLGRDMIRTSYYLAELLDAGVEIHYYLTGEQERGDDPTQRLMSVVRGYAAEDHRVRSSQRARDALERKAQKGYNTGGVVYGYDNVVVTATNSAGQEIKSHTDYRINEQQAEVVRGIFRMYADGHGVGKIAKTLNGEPRYTALAREYFGAQVPSPPRKGTGSWAPTTIHPMLRRVRYTGVVPFGEFRKMYRGGTKKRAKQDTRLLAPRPELRIVPEDLWNRVQERLGAVRETYVKSTGGQWFGRPVNGRESPYLLAGFMRCECCGASMRATYVRSGPPQKRKHIHCYVCSYYSNRGANVCSNKIRPRMAEVDRDVIEAVERTALIPEVADAIMADTLRKLRQLTTDRPKQGKKLEAELAREERELDRFMVLIASGRAPNRILEEIHRREERIKALKQELGSLPSGGLTELDDRRLRKTLTAQMGRYRDLMHSDVATGRRALRELLNGPIWVVPKDGGYTLKGEARLGVLLPASLTLASPRGFEPRLPP